MKQPSRTPGSQSTANTSRIPMYQVVLENDELHSFEFVVEVLRKSIGCSEQNAANFANEAHSRGRSIVWTGTREVAELKVEQIRSFHEIRVNGKKLGPLHITIEPAP
jgi:ATP-dependent Clp protease adaptor protein ClpS